MGILKRSRAGLIAAGAVGALALAALAGTAVANAADAPSAPSPSQSQAPASSGTQMLPPRHAPEEALTGATADQVEAAVAAKYPDATIDRMEKDAGGEGVYEAHITKADGSHVLVLLDASFSITGEHAGGPRGPGGPQPSSSGPGLHRTPEEELTGATADQVKAAVSAKYPDATIDRMEKDADEGSAYEAHITKADGTHAKVMLDASFTITDEHTGGPGGPRGFGDHQGPRAASPAA